MPIFNATAATGPNAACARNGVATLAFSGIAAVPTESDLCAKPVESVPPAIRAILDEIGGIHRSVARAIGQTEAETVGAGVSLAFFGSPDGPLASYTLRDASRIVLTVFPDWRPPTWTPKAYAHEFVHYLVYRGGAFAGAVDGLTNHPFVTEGLPDLVALTTYDDPIMPIEDPGLPACLRTSRDATPTRSLDAPFADYALFAPSEAIRACCATLPRESRSAHVQSICARGEDGGADAFYAAVQALGGDLRPPSAAELAAPFRPEACRFRMKGWDTLEACNTHQFALPLTSFFFELRRALGRPLVADWIRLLKAEAPARFRCAYRAAGTEAVELRLRGLAPSLRALGATLAPDERAAFARVWREHGFDKIAAMDALYTDAGRKALALEPLLAKNPQYGGSRGCGSLYTIDPAACALDCAAIP